MKPLISILLETHLEREELVRHQNEMAERAAIDRWAAKPRRRKKVNRCKCGFEISLDSTMCGECACEEDCC